MDNNIKRGDVYYIEGAKDTVGAEMVKTRPGIVISSPEQTPESHVLTVVYLSNKEQKPHPAHIKMRHCGLRGTALCEHIYTVDLNRVGMPICTLTPDEMDEVQARVDYVMGLELAKADNGEAELPRRIILDAMKGGK